MIPAGVASKVPWSKFVAKVKGRTVSQTIAGSSGSGSTTYRSWLVHSLSASGSMYGSPYDGADTYCFSAYNRVVQHMVQSYAVFAALVTNGDWVYVAFTNQGSQPTYALNRNSYTSITDLNDDFVYWGPYCEYWDYTLNVARRYTGGTSYSNYTAY